MMRIKVLLLAMSTALPADGAFRTLGMINSYQMNQRNRRTMSFTLGGSTSTALSLDPRVAKMYVQCLKPLLFSIFELLSFC
jgi:hypothetical protein